MPITTMLLGGKGRKQTSSLGGNVVQVFGLKNKQQHKTPKFSPEKLVIMEFPENSPSTKGTLKPHSKYLKIYSYQDAIKWQSAFRRGRMYVDIFYSIASLAIS